MWTVKCHSSWILLKGNLCLDHLIRCLKDQRCLWFYSLRALPFISASVFLFFLHPNMQWLAVMWNIWELNQLLWRYSVTRAQWKWCRRDLRHYLNVHQAEGDGEGWKEGVEKSLWCVCSASVFSASRGHLSSAIQGKHMVASWNGH